MGGATLKIIYYCFAGAHASVVAAAIHCGLLPVDRTPLPDEFAALPYYDLTPPEQVGQPFLMGRDEWGHTVYFMGMWSQRRPLTAALTTLFAAAAVDRRDYLFQDAFPLINFSTKLGGLLSKRYRISGFGRRITIWGLRREYSRFVELVATVKRTLA